MTRRLPPLQWLRSFDAVCRLGSLTAAAKELAMTQAAMSQHIKLLEGWCNETLFDRIPRGLRKTEAALALQPIVESALNQLADGLMRSDRLSQQQTVTLKVPPSIASFWLPRRISELQKSFTDINFRVVSEVWPNQNDPSVDIEIRHGAGNWPNANAQRLNHDILSALVQPGVAAEYGFNFGQLIKHLPLIDILGYRRGWHDWARKNGLSLNGCNYVQSDSEPFAINSALQGSGILLGRHALICDQMAKQALVPVRNSGKEIDAVHDKEGFYLLINNDHESANSRHKDRLENICAWLVQAFANIKH